MPGRTLRMRGINLNMWILCMFEDNFSLDIANFSSCYSFRQWIAILGCPFHDIHPFLVPCCRGFVPWSCFFSSISLYLASKNTDSRSKDCKTRPIQDNTEHEQARTKWTQQKNKTPWKDQLRPVQHERPLCLWIFYTEQLNSLQITWLLNISVGSVLESESRAIWLFGQIIHYRPLYTSYTFVFVYG